VPLPAASPCTASPRSTWCPRTPWIRLDARGNKEGADARFCLEGEHLAWPVAPSRGEIDYPLVHTSPPPAVVAALATARPGIAG
jgi:hypothetical protein